MREVLEDAELMGQERADIYEEEQSAARRAREYNLCHKRCCVHGKYCCWCKSRAHPFMYYRMSRRPYDWDSADPNAWCPDQQYPWYR